MGDIVWSDDEDHSPAVEFRVDVVSAPGYPVFIRGSYNRLAGALSYGARVIYLYLENHAVIYLLTLYTKKEQTDLSPEQKKAISSVVEEIKRAYRGRVQLR